jgi:hypothetical protein
MVVAGSVAFALTRIGHSAPFPFRSVTAAELAKGAAGVTLSAATPPANLPVTASEASASASRYQGRRPALEVHYALCIDPRGGFHPIHRDCWAVSIEPDGLRPSGGIYTGPPNQTIPYAKVFSYDLVFVDANTGKVIEATWGSSNGAQTTFPGDPLEP